MKHHAGPVLRLDDIIALDHQGNEWSMCCIHQYASSIADV